MNSVALHPTERHSRRRLARRCVISGVLGSVSVMALAGCDDGAMIMGAAPNDPAKGAEAGDVPAAMDGIVMEGAGASGATSGAAVEPPAAAGGSDSPHTAVGGVSGGAIGDQEQAPADWSSPPILFERVSLADEELARQALTLMGSSSVGASGSCATCHSLGRPTLTRWLQLTNGFADACLGSTALPDAAAVEAMYGCFSSHSTSSAALAPSDFGIYSAAAHLPWFSYVLERTEAAGGDGAAFHQHFVERVGMPRAGDRWSQADFNLLAEWFARGLPGLFALVPEDSGEDCSPGLDARLAAHIDGLAAQGWRARNAEVPLLMYGCAAGQSGAQCLGDLPAAAAQPYGAGWDVVPGTTIRVLWDNSAALTTYWSRSSPDGRYIASGLARPDELGYTGQIVDLERQRVIHGDFAYDATFFPDNSGFMVQRGSYAEPPPGGLPTDGQPGSGDVAITCEQSVLAGDVSELSGDEPECTSLTGQVGLYEQLSKSLDGEDYWVVYGAFGEDDGGFRVVLENPAAAFDSQSNTTLLPMINQGNGFEPGVPTRVATPHQGDPMLSPSGRLLVTRVKGKERVITVGGTEIVTAEQSGYALHLIETTQSGASWTASLQDVGRLCVNGSKPVLSYDERWMVYHHYVTAADAPELGFDSASDPGFRGYAESGASNIYLVDLLTGESQRITNTAPGQYALFPHFRSDGWLYFVVRTLGTEEYFVASDAALMLESAR
jgi:hypothetical protein